MKKIDGEHLDEGSFWLAFDCKADEITESASEADYGWLLEKNQLDTC